jgi:RIO kinase 1
VKSNVLMMKFIGEKMQPAPKLKDIDLDQKEWNELYLDVIQDMRVLYQECHLIHADFSEYNCLYWKGKPVCIDVSQSIEHDHPSALYFLRKDCFNVNNFFKKKGVLVFGLKQFFDFVTDLNLRNVEEALQSLIENRYEDTEEE